MSLPAQLIRYGKATARWVAAGRPVRTDNRVRELFDWFCRPCRHYDAANERCRLCGCRVAMTGPAALNKLMMATERCADAPPQWFEEVDTQ